MDGVFGVVVSAEGPRGLVVIRDENGRTTRRVFVIDPGAPEDLAPGWCRNLTPAERDQVEAAVVAEAR